MSLTNSDQSSATSSLPSELTAALAEFAARERILVVSDFDGTLAPLLPQPMAVAAHPGGMQALLELATQPNTHVALLSGRDRTALRTLAQRTGPAGQDVSEDSSDQVRDLGEIVLAGSHGAESEATGAQLSDAAIAARDDVFTAAEEIAQQDATDSVILERKPAGVVFHTAQLGDKDQAQKLQQAFTDRVDQISQQHPAVGWNAGKDIIEVHVTDVNKGTWIAKAGDYYGADAIIFAGDDTTDENAFAALSPQRGDIGIKVGDGDTAAAFRVSDTDAIAAVFQRLAELRTNA